MQGTDPTFCIQKFSNAQITFSNIERIVEIGYVILMVESVVVYYVWSESNKVVSNAPLGV